VSKSRSLFDDPAERIEELTAIVKQDIQHIRGKIEALHTLMGSQRYQTAQMSEHSGTVIQTLNNNLMQATERFRKVLEVRTEVRHRNKVFCIFHRLILFPLFDRISSLNKKEKRSLLDPEEQEPYLSTSPSIQRWIRTFIPHYFNYF
jgi:hypothetical protein